MVARSPHRSRYDLIWTLTVLLWTAILFLLTAAAQEDLCSNSSLERKELVDDNARCGDHSKAVYYINKTASTNGKWIIFLEGGGVCSSLCDCNRRYQKEPYLLSSNQPVYADHLCGTDVFNRMDEKNPFRDFNHVMLPYCSQDLYIGMNPSRSGTFNNGSASTKCSNTTLDPGYIFAGDFIFKALVRELQLEDMNTTTHLVLAGTSAGALGVMNQVRWVKERLPGVEVSLLLDSGWIIDYQTIASRRLFTHYARRSGNITVRAACQVRYNRLPCCLSPLCLLQNTRVGVPADVRVILISSTYDLFMLQKAYSTRQERNPSTTVESVLSFISDYGGAMNQTLNVPRFRNLTSLVQTQCAQHTYLVSSSLWENPMLRDRSLQNLELSGLQYSHHIRKGVWATYQLKHPGTSFNGLTLQRLIGKWWTHNENFAVRDSCSGMVCNENCPDALTQVASESKHGPTFQVIVLILAIFATASTFLIKIGLMLHLVVIHRSLTEFLDEPDKKLSDCLPESSNVSVACKNLSFQLRVPIVGKVEVDDALIENGTYTMTPMGEDLALVDGGSGDLHSSNGTRPVKRSASSPVGTGTGFTRQGGSHRQHSAPTYGKSKSMPASTRTDTPPPGVKVIINGVTAYFNSGMMVAIMGPSGAGKTTLMDLLTGRRAGEVDGEVLVNGYPLDSVHHWYHSNTGYVRQLATPFYDELTVRENLLYSALLRLPSSHSRAEIFEQMKMVIAEVGLSDIEERVVGGSTGGGISGGEKKRLYVAMQLMGMPNILFLDEPTSGLDSTAAKELLDVLHIVAQGNRLVIVSIHQPRPEIYHLFSRIMFLCKGQVAFFGKPQHAVDFFMKAVKERNPDSFQKLARDPEKSNPADLILDALNDERNQECILEHYAGSPEPRKILQAVRRAKRQAGKQSVFGRTEGRSFWMALLCLEGRLRRQSWGKALYLPLVFLVYGVGVGLAYLQASKGFLLLAAFNLLTNISFLFVSPALTNVILGRCLHIFEMEHGDGVMRVSHLVLHTFMHMTAITVIPFAILTTAIFNLVSTVGTFSDFLLIFLVNVTANATDIAIVILICVAVPSYATPIAHVVCAYVTFFEGFLYPLPDIHSALAWMIYGNPNYYAFSSEMNLLLSGRKLSCNASLLECGMQDGNTILKQFGFENADVYEALLILMCMTVFYLLMSMIALLPKGYIRNYITNTFFPEMAAKKKKNDDMHEESGMLAERIENVHDQIPLLDDGNQSPTEEEEHQVNVAGPFVHTNFVWTQTKRQATRHNMGGATEVKVPYEEGSEGVRSRAGSVAKSLVDLNKRKSFVITAGAESGSEARITPRQTSKFRLTMNKLQHPTRAATPTSVTVPTTPETPADQKAKPFAQRWLYRTRVNQGRVEEGSEGEEGHIIFKSIMKWTETVHDKQLQKRREQSKRQVHGNYRLMEDSLMRILTDVRSRSDAEAVADGSMSQSEASARQNWTRLTQKVHKKTDEDVHDGDMVPPSTDNEPGSLQQRRPSTERPKKVTIATMPEIYEENVQSVVLPELERSPRPRLLSAGKPAAKLMLPPTVSPTSQKHLLSSPTSIGSAASSLTSNTSQISVHSDEQPPLKSSLKQSSSSSVQSVPSRSRQGSVHSDRPVPVPILSEEPLGKMRRQTSYHSMVTESASSSPSSTSPGSKMRRQTSYHSMVTESASSSPSSSPPSTSPSSRSRRSSRRSNASFNETTC